MVTSGVLCLFWQIIRIPPEGLSEDVISSLVNKRPNQFKFSPLVLENGNLVSQSHYMIIVVVTVMSGYHGYIHVI